MYSLVRPLLFSLAAEDSHRLTMAALKRLSPMLIQKNYQLPNPVYAMGLKFPNPIGLAAGLDKNGECIDALAKFGFGSIEIGTVTPRPQPGNETPRMFRLTSHHAIINRMGFNNDGADKMVENLNRTRFKGIIGINIGKNKDTPLEEAHNDYLICMDKLYTHASYITINISSPNTPGLRQLQFGDALKKLLGVVKEKQHDLSLKYQKYVPVAVKIAPDMTFEETRAIANTFIETGVDGVIATNTTASRKPVEGHEFATEEGGLSGAPLFPISNQTTGILLDELRGRIPVIGVGGIDSADTAMDKIEMGCKLVQLYTGFIYKGPNLINDIFKRYQVTH